MIELFVHQAQRIASKTIKDFGNALKQAGQRIIHPEAQAGNRPSLGQMVGNVEQKFQTGVVEPSKTLFASPTEQFKQMDKPTSLKTLAAGIGLTTMIDDLGRVKQIPKIAKQAVGEGKQVVAKVAQESKLIFKGYKDLTTKFLEYAKGKTTLSKQEVMDFARRPELKKGEADLLNRLGSELKEGKVSAQEFAESIRRDLLELKPNPRRIPLKDSQYKGYNIDAREGTKNGKNYEEVVFESPITTNGSSHYPNSKNYFAHARGDEVVESRKKIWREQEIQSDLLQKENLDKIFGTEREIVEKGIKLEEIPSTAGDVKNYQQLQPFTSDRFGERIMRERIKEKASKGYEKYRLPTGETIGKIEGFEAGGWTTELGEAAIPSNVAIGDRIMLGGHDPYIVTKKLDNGQIKAINEVNFPSARNLYDGTEFVGDDKGMKSIIKRDNENYSETFDLTGKSNPQYRRYSDWGKFLKNKYGGQLVTDPQGNSWMEIDLKPEYKRLPIEAFAVAPILMTDQDQSKKP